MTGPEAGPRAAGAPRAEPGATGGAVGGGRTASLPARGQGAAGGDQSSKPLHLGRMLQGTVQTASLPNVGPLTSAPGPTMRGYIIVLEIPWSTLQVKAAKGAALPFHIQTGAPTADGQSDIYYFGNGTKPSGAAVATFGTLTLG